MFDAVEVELLLVLVRSGVVYSPSDFIRVSLPEAQSLFATGFAKPLGAGPDFGRYKLPVWMTAWRP